MSKSTKVYLSNKAYVYNPTTDMVRWIQCNLTLDNPEYHKKVQMGLYVGNTQPYLILYERRGDTYILPTGVVDNFLFLYKDQIGSVERSRELDLGMYTYNSTISLFPYQEKAIKHCTRSGVVVMPCGSGKTQTALELVARMGVRALWITHTHELLQQSKNRALSCYQLPPDCFGDITEGKVNVGRLITFATVQTLSNIDLEPYKSYWDLVIVDECHKAVGTPTKLMMFYKCVSALDAPIKIGLTATPNRSDGLETCMYALLGNKLCEITEDEVATNRVPLEVHMVHSGVYEPNENRILKYDGTIDFNGLLEDLCEDETRNKAISEYVNYVNSVGKTVLVLSDRVNHLHKLRHWVGEDYTAVICAKKDQSRKNALENLKHKNLRCLFATYALAKEGLDIPSLDAVFFATPKKDATIIVQSAGRAGRKCDGKAVGYVIDWVDTQFSMLTNYAKRRKSIYKKHNYQIVEEFYEE